MPEMPTITVTLEQQARILEAYKDFFGTTTTAETVAAYKQMLIDMITSQVISYEHQKAARLNSIDNEVKNYFKTIT